MNTHGTYELYAEDKLTLARDGTVILFFKASWCPTCRVLDTDIKNNIDSIPEGVHILEVDYDTNAALRRQYGVTVQHTLVEVDMNGALIQKWSGGSTLQSVLNRI